MLTHSEHSFIPRIVTVACAKLYSSTTGAGALAKLTPCTPVSILLYDIWGQPDAVTFKAMLKQAKNTRRGWYLDAMHGPIIFLRQNVC